MASFLKWAMSTESLLSGDVVVAAEANTLSLVQVTDTHLTGTETGCLLGINTARSARGVIDAALAIEGADCILVTGDIAADGQPEGRSLLRDFSYSFSPEDRIGIIGPNGSGKELAARCIHHQSDRRDSRFIVANCARLGAERADVELFGSDGVATSRRIVGLFEQAHKGTLYFDEVCDLPLETQGKIVRAVAEQRFRRVGGNKEVSVDVRVISASSRDLSAAIAEGRLREDLYYRLGVVPLSMPPLAERREDIPHLARHFVDLLARRTGLGKVKLGDEVLSAMQGYRWPGNVRQMLNTIENMLIMAPVDRSEPLGLELLPAEIQNISPAAGNSDIDALLALPLRNAREAFEKSYMTAQLQRFDGNVSQMAGFVGMERSALHRKLRSLDVTNGGKTPANEDGKT